MTRAAAACPSPARLCSYGSFQMDVPACLYMRLCVCVCVRVCFARAPCACACTPAATRRRKLARRHGRFSQRPRRIAGYHASSRTRAPLSPTRPARYCSTPPCGHSVFGAESRRSTRHGACHTGRSHSCSRRGSAPVAARRRTLSPPEPPAPHIRQSQPSHGGVRMHGADAAVDWFADEAESWVDVAESWADVAES